MRVPRDGTDSRLRIQAPLGNSIAARTEIELAPLGHENPRWARSDSNARTANRLFGDRTAAEASPTGGSAELKRRMAVLAYKATAGEDMTDLTATATILRTEPQAAETEAAGDAAAAARDNNEIEARANPVASETIPSPILEQPTQSGLLGEEPLAKIAAVDAKAPIEPATPRREARTTADVNMRAGAGGDASVITIVPAGASVGVIGCDAWCEVAYDGRRGWIYRGFVSGYGSSKARKPAASRTSPETSSVDRPVASVTSEGQSGAQSTAEVGFFKSFVRGCVDCDSTARPPALPYR